MRILLHRTLHARVLEAKSLMGISPDRAANINYGAFQGIDESIAILGGETGDNLMLTKTFGPEQIAELVSRQACIPVTGLGQNGKEN